jgi:DNA-binding transcriptional ArsR family regulator
VRTCSLPCDPYWLSCGYVTHVTYSHSDPTILLWSMMNVMSTTTLDERVGTDKLNKVSELLRAAAHPQRLAILDALGHHARLCNSELQELLDLEQAILSQHLTLMRDKGLLGCEKEGKYSFYYLQATGLLEDHQGPGELLRAPVSMEILGYIGAILMGLVPRPHRRGRSILTVPILVYLFMVEPVLATAYSLFIVGLTSLGG